MLKTEAHPLVEMPADSRPVLERSAVEALIAKHYTGLRLLILRRVGDREVAQDLLQEAVRTTWEKWQMGSIQRPEQIGGYIFKVALNLLRNLRRSAHERHGSRLTPEALEALPEDTDGTDRWQEKKIALRVKRILQAMSSPRDREVLIRVYLDEEDREVICRDLGLDTDQFDKVLHRARTRLRSLLEAHGLKRTDFFMFL
jgi:RNA polymerase sigma-70 factor, ECF subfamily